MDDRGRPRASAPGPLRLHDAARRSRSRPPDRRRSGRARARRPVGTGGPPRHARPEGPESIDYASLEFEVERMRKRLAIWEIFMAYIRDGRQELARGAALTHVGGLHQDRGDLRRRPSPGSLARHAVDGHGPVCRACVTEGLRPLLATATHSGKPGSAGTGPRDRGGERTRPGLAGPGLVRSHLQRVSQRNSDCGQPAASQRGDERPRVTVTEVSF